MSARAMKERPKPERIGTADAAAILGRTPRCVQALALRGKLPDAAKIGGGWSFTESALRNYIREQTACPPDQKRQNTPIGGMGRYGPGSPLADVNIERAYEQAMSNLGKPA